MTGHSLERAYNLLPAFSTLYLVQLPCSILLYSLPDEAVLLKLYISEIVEAFTDGAHCLIRLYPQAELCNLTYIKVAQLP